MKLHMSTYFLKYLKQENMIDWVSIALAGN